MKLLDCTIRDGGYYNHWDFSDELVKNYFRNMELLPVDILEIGYRSIPQKKYEGKYFYCPDFVLKQVKSCVPSKQLAIMLNEKDCKIEDLDYLLTPCQGLIDIVRMAISPDRFDEALVLAKDIKQRGFKVGFNIMYMSTLDEKSPVFEKLCLLDELVDYFSLVDSYGGIYPSQVRKIVEICKSKTSVPIGFHGHNNMELVFANSIAAVEAGCEIIDSTIMGMGRGAGNLKTELWLTHLSTKYNLNVDFNALGEVLSEFEVLHNTYHWGTNLPYMVSGSNSLPQKNVMDWVTKRFYSINSIVRALQNQKRGDKDNVKLSVLEKQAISTTAIIIGGGPQVYNCKDAIISFLNNNKEVSIIHASTKHANLFKELDNEQYYCLVGNEGHRMEAVFSDLKKLEGYCILPPFPRKMGTYIPIAMTDKAVELKQVTFNSKINDSHTALALQTAIDLGIKNLYIAGYDGYPNQSIAQKEQDLVNENNYLFHKASIYFNEFATITNSRYEIENQISIYQLNS